MTNLSLECGTLNLKPNVIIACLLLILLLFLLLYLRLPFYARFSYPCVATAEALLPFLFLCLLLVIWRSDTCSVLKKALNRVPAGKRKFKKCGQKCDTRLEICYIRYSVENVPFRATVVGLFHLRFCSTSLVNKIHKQSGRWREE